MMEWDPEAPEFELEGDPDTRIYQENRWTNVYGMSSTDFDRFWDLCKKAVVIMPRPVGEVYDFCCNRVWANWKAGMSWAAVLDDVESDLLARGLLTQPEPEI